MWQVPAHQRNRSRVQVSWELKSHGDTCQGQDTPLPPEEGMGPAASPLCPHLGLCREKQQT